MKHLSGPACMPTYSTSRCFFFFNPFPFHFLPPSQILSASLAALSFIVSLPRVNTVASANNFPVFQTLPLPFTADR